MSFAPLLEQIRESKSVVFVTGAGISQESGIPTFRGKDGLWRNRDVMRLATIQAFEEDPGMVWEWYVERRQNIRGARPNPGHEAVAALERRADVAVVTQNIDGLHQRAGSSHVVELHGNITRTVCASCGVALEYVGDVMPPACACGGMPRPDVVWFGEELPRGAWKEAARLAGACDMMVIAGTSLAVSPANMLPAEARRGGATLVEVNTDATPMSDMMDLSVRGRCSELLPELASLF